MSILGFFVDIATQFSRVGFLGHRVNVYLALMISKFSKIVALIYNPTSFLKHLSCSTSSPTFAMPVCLFLAIFVVWQTAVVIKRDYYSGL